MRDFLSKVALALSRSRPGQGNVRPAGHKDSRFRVAILKAKYAKFGLFETVCQK